MSKNATPTGFQRMATQAFQDQNTLESYTQKNFGLSAKQMDLALRTMMSVSQGRMPDTQGMKFINDAAKHKYGWTESRTKSELKQILEKGSPEERLAMYLTANGHKALNEHEYRLALGLTEQGLRADLESGLENRLAENKGNNVTERRFEGMPANKQTLEDSKDKADMRATLNRLMGVNDKPTYQSRVQNVLKARSQLADRIEVQAVQQAEGHTPSLRESLANTYDEKYVASASEDLGLGNPIDEAENSMADQEHINTDFDVTEKLND